MELTRGLEGGQNQDERLHLPGALILSAVTFAAQKYTHKTFATIAKAMQ